MLAKKLLEAAGNAGGANLYVEDVFSTYLYTGNGTSQTITNGIDLDGEGGMVWIKNRDQAYSNVLFDTVRGAQQYLSSNSSLGQGLLTTLITSFNNDGFSLGSQPTGNVNGDDIASWTFRKAEKFFDVVYWVGNGTGARTISHSLNGTVGALFMKATNADMQWFSYHNGLTNAQFLELNATTQAVSSANAWNNTTPTSSEFTVGSYGNVSGRGYIAYLFASDAGGFGGDGSESIIKCGSFTGNTTVDLGFEPAWIMIKPTSTAGNWDMHDVMRGWPSSGDAKRLKANSSEAETSTSQIYPNATGFSTLIGSASYIYIAIRRPMKTPESGTEVFNLSTASAGTAITNNFAADSWFGNNTSGNGGANAHTFASRLTGLKWLQTATNAAEFTASNTFYWDSNTTFTNSQFGGGRVEYFLKRATGFFDVVATTHTFADTGSLAHNLVSTPEMIITKLRSPGVDSWLVYTATSGTGKYLSLNSTASLSTNVNVFPSVTSTSFVFSPYSNTGNYISYLFATLAGVSKVGTYSGTGSNVNVDCGFSAGARFILIKRTDSTGDWYVWDSARGIVAGNDPYLLLNTTAADVTSTDYIDPLSSGFTVTSNASGTVNVSGGLYIFLAIA